MTENPRFIVKADDDDNGTITVYVQCLPEDCDHTGDTDRWACFEYPEGWGEDRATARSQAKAKARVWCWEIAKKYPCQWGTNWEEPR